MSRPRLGLRLLDHATAFCVRDDLIGDLVEEIDRGRSRWWVCRQLAGVCGLAVAAQLRNRKRPTPPVVALLFGGTLAACSSIVSVSAVLQAWLGFYLAIGTLSLFGHMAARAIGSRGTLYPSADAPGDD
jgi:hypothetical protein